MLIKLGVLLATGTVGLLLVWFSIRLREDYTYAFSDLVDTAIVLICTTGLAMLLISGIAAVLAVAAWALGLAG